MHPPVCRCIADRHVDGKNAANRADGPYNVAVGEDRLFTDQEAEQILSRAAKGTTGGISEDRLVQMADELGIDRAAVLEAAQQTRAESEERAERREFEIYQRRGLLNHLTSYVTVNIGLMGLNFVDEHRISWAWWVVAGWGIGILTHLRAAFAKGTSDYEKEFARWRQKRRDGRVVGYPSPTLGIHVNTGSSMRSSRTSDPLRIEELLPIVEGEALRENLSRLEAIRRLRDQTGVSLVDAKNAVEAFDRANPGILRA
jgi:2TM domain-containing protein